MFQKLGSAVVYTVLYSQKPSVESVIEAEGYAHNLLKEYWKNEVFLEWRWWVLIILSVVPAVVWWRLADKKRIFEILTYGLFLGVIVIILDSIGSNAMIWFYPETLTPYLFPQLYPYDVALIIIPFMLVFQWTLHSTNKFLLYNLLLSFILAFIAETTMERFDFYREIRWENYFSFPIYFSIGTICRAIVIFLLGIKEKAISHE